jgi:preprotein translocase subunit Sec63
MSTILFIVLIILLGAMLPTFPYRMHRQSAPATPNGHANRSTMSLYQERLSTLRAFIELSPTG